MMIIKLNKCLWIKKVHGVFNPDWFKSICLFVSILGCIPIFSNLVTPFLKFFHVYAVVVVLFDLFGERRIIRNKGRCLLLMLLVCYAVTLLCNPSLITLSGLSDFGYVLIALAVVYSYGEKSWRNDRIGGNVICGILSLLNFVGIWMFFTKFFVYYAPTGSFIGMYVHENRLCGVWGNPAVQGMMSFIGLCLSGILFFDYKGKRRSIYIMFGGINFVTMLLANARTAIYCFVCICTVFTFLCLIKHKSGTKQLVYTIGISLTVMVIVFSGCQFIQHGISLMDVRYDYYLCNIDESTASMRLDAQKKQNDIGTKKYNQTNDKNTNVQLNEQREQNDSGTEKRNQENENKYSQMTIGRESKDLNGRGDLWKVGVELVMRKPLFGHGLNNLDDSLLELGYSPLNIDGNLHNVYLDVLVAYGLIGFGCLAVFLLVMLGNVKKYFKYHTIEDWEQGAIRTAAIVGFLLYAMVDSSPMFSMYPMAIVFWYILSELADLTEQGNKCSGHYRPELLALLEEKWILKRNEKSICFVNDSLGGGGAEHILLNVANAMVKEGYSVTILTLWSGDVLESRLDSRVTLKTIDPFDCFLLKRMQHWLNRHYMPKRLYNFLFLDYRYEYTVAFLEGLSTILVANTKVRKGDIKYAWVHIDLKEQNWVLPYYSSKRAQVASYQTFRRIFCVSNEVRQAFVDVIGYEDKVVTQINLLDTHRVQQLGKELCLVDRPKGLLLCAVGRLNPQKGFDRLISVMYRLLKAGVNCTLWIMGEGACRVVLEQQIEELNLVEHVKLLGFCKNPYCYCMQADVFVSSSYAEGYSTVITENLLLGKPIVSTLCAGVQEQLGDSEFGLVVENTEEALFEGVKKILTDKNLRAYYEEKALERSRNISYDVILGQYIKIFSLKGELQ